MKCGSCGFSVSASASQCPYCGAKLKNRTPFLGKLILIIVAVAVLFPSLLTGALFQGVGSTLLPLCVIAVAAFLLMGGKKK